MKMANEILNSFKSHPEAWQVVDSILMKNDAINVSKFFNNQIKTKRLFFNIIF